MLDKVVTSGSAHQVAKKAVEWFPRVFTEIKTRFYTLWSSKLVKSIHKILDILYSPEKEVYSY